MVRVDDGKDCREEQCECEYRENREIRWFSSTSEVQESREDRGVSKLQREATSALSHAITPDSEAGDRLENVQNDDIIHGLRSHHPYGHSMTGLHISITDIKLVLLIFFMFHHGKHIATWFKSP